VEKLVNIIDSINEKIGNIIAWTVLAMVIITFLVVVLRYGFDWGSIAMQESASYFHALIFMAGAAYTFKHGGHVRVDIFYQKFSDRKKALVEIVGAVFLLIPVCIFILWTSADYVFNSWLQMESSREAGGLPLVFLLKSFIPLFAILLLLQAIASILKAWLTLNTTLNQKGTS
jgi:TRAP-type mannitol/chloroaromatic compound transport system permease small subunit